MVKTREEETWLIVLQKEKSGGNTMRKKTKRWLAALVAAFLCMGAAERTMPMTVKAAQNSETMTVTTTQRCSIWSAPVTAEENRVKYVDAGYQITVYPEVIQSEQGDGKTFYRTVRGSYVLCRCVEGTVGNGVGTAAAGGAVNGDNVAVLLPVPPMPEPSVLAFGTVVESGKRYRGASGGASVVFSEYGIWEKDASGKIKWTWYHLDGTLSECYYYVIDYDAMGNEIKHTKYGADGVTVKSVSIMEYDAQGNKVKEVDKTYDWSELRYGYDPVATVYEYEYDAFGNRVKEWDTSYYLNGTMLSSFTEGMEGYDMRYSDGYWMRVKHINTYYNADGTMLASRVFKYEYNAAGRRISETETVYDADGTMLASRVSKDEYDAAGSHINNTLTYYDASGVPVPSDRSSRELTELVEIFNRDWLGIWWAV